MTAAAAAAVKGGCFITAYAFISCNGHDGNWLLVMTDACLSRALTRHRRIQFRNNNNNAGLNLLNTGRDHCNIFSCTKYACTNITVYWGRVKTTNFHVSTNIQV